MGEEPMKDFREQPLHRGDNVAYIKGWSDGAKYLVEGTVLRVTPKGATVITPKENPNLKGAGTFVKSSRIVKILAGYQLGPAQ